MAKNTEKNLALKLRHQDLSYSQIQSRLNVSKSTLSNWLKDFPLSSQRINELRSNNPKRIERFRNTMKKKRDKGFEEVFQKVKNEIGVLSKRELLIGGIFLYWGEGSKSADYTTSVSNTDPDVIKFFIKWLSLFGVKRNNLKINLHLYNDMSINKEVNFWAKELQVPHSCFRKPYIKESKFSNLSYKNGFGHGTCNVRYSNKEVWQYSMMALKYIKSVSV